MKTISRTLNTFTVETVQLNKTLDGNIDVVENEPVIVVASNETDARKAIKLSDGEVIVKITDNGSHTYSMPVDDFIRYAGFKD